jgi:hypothetical protein
MKLVAILVGGMSASMIGVALGAIALARLASKWTYTVFPAKSSK